MATPIRVTKRDSIYAKKLGRFAETEEDLEPKPQSSIKREQYIQAVLSSSQKPRSPPTAHIHPVNFSLAKVVSPVGIKSTQVSPLGVRRKVEAETKSVDTTKNESEAIEFVLPTLARLFESADESDENIPPTFSIKIVACPETEVNMPNAPAIEDVCAPATEDDFAVALEDNKVSENVVSAGSLYQDELEHANESSTEEEGENEINNKTEDSCAQESTNIDHRSLLNVSLQGGETEDNDDTLVLSESFSTFVTVGSSFVNDAANRSFERRRAEAEKVEQEQQELIHELEAELSHMRSDLEKELQLLEESKRVHPETARLREANSELEQRINSIRSTVHMTIADKQRIKKDNIRSALAYYESKRVTERIREKMEKIREQFEKKKEEAEQLVMRKFELDRVQDENNNKSSVNHHSRLLGSATLHRRSKAEAQREQEELNKIKAENAALQKQLVELETAAMQQALQEFQQKADAAHSDALNESIMMQDICTKVKKSTDTTIVVEESLVL